MVSKLPQEEWRILYRQRDEFAKIMMNKNIRRKVYEKSGGHCFYCGKKIETSSRKFHVDHFIPLHDGGVNELPNFVPSCQTCNLRKGNKGIEEWRESIKHSIIKTKLLLSVLEGILKNGKFWFERN